MSALEVVVVGDCRGEVVGTRSLLGKEAVERLRSGVQLAGTFS